MALLLQLLTLACAVSAAQGRLGGKKESAAATMEPTMEPSAMPMTDAPTTLDVAIANFALNVSPALVHSLQPCIRLILHLMELHRTCADSVLSACCSLTTVGVPGGRVLLIRRY
jgi:hypothetical protein